MMNYHELTATGTMEKQNKNQYLFLMLLGGGFLGHAIITAGAFASVKIKNVDFIPPHGEYIYKFRQRDYAASIGTCRRISDELGIDYTSDEASYKFYTIFLDDPSETPSGKERWMAGYVLNNENSENNNKEHRSLLVEKNKMIGQGTCSIGDKECMEKYDNIPFEFATWPKVGNHIKTAYVEFPFHNGIASALVQNYKILPTLQQYIRQHALDKHSKDMPIIITTCSVSDSTCKYYGILEKSSKFLLGSQQTTSEYVKILQELKEKEGSKNGFLDNMDDNIRDLYRGIKKTLNL